MAGIGEIKSRFFTVFPVFCFEKEVPFRQVFFYFWAMNLAEFVSRFSGCFSPQVALSIKADTVFRELEEWNSMMALIIISMVDSDFGKELSADDIRASVTVEDLFNKIS